MSIGWYVGLFVASLMFLVCHLVCSSLNYQKRFSEKYDVRNHFPYEFNFESSFSLNLFGNIALIMSCALSIAFFSLTSAKIQTNGYVLYSLISEIIYSILVCVIHFIPLKFMKTHTIFGVLLLGASFITPVAVGLGAFSLYQDSNKTYPLVLFIISITIAVFYFCVAMNPKLTPNIKMIVGKDKDGKEIYIRPKFIVMALSEWIDIFGLSISQLLLVLLLIAIL